MVQQLLGETARSMQHVVRLWAAAWEMARAVPFRKERGKNRPRAWDCDELWGWQPWLVDPT